MTLFSNSFSIGYLGKLANVDIAESTILECNFPVMTHSLLE